MKKLSAIGYHYSKKIALGFIIMQSGHAMPSLPTQSTNTTAQVAGNTFISSVFPTLPLLPTHQASTLKQATTKESTNEQGATTVADASPINNDSNTQTEAKSIYLNFENTDLSNFIDYIADLKKLNIIPDKTLQGSKISLTIREPLSVDGAWNIFLTVLEMANFSIIQAGEVYKILPKDKKLMQPLPAYVNVPYDVLPDNDATIRYVTFLTNIQVGEVRPLLESMLSTPNAVHDQKDMNAFVIVDKSNNIKAAVKLLQELDHMGLPENVTVLKLKRINAIDAKQLLDALIRKPDTNNPFARLLGKTAEGGTEYFSPTTRIIPEERTNSLILLGNSKSIDKIVDFITKHIDTQIKSASSPLHIYELQHIDATQAASILKDVTAPPDSATGGAASKYGSIRGGVKYFKPINFQVDKDGNRLLVSCLDKQDWHLLKQTLKDLDKPQPQVAVEVLYVSVEANDSKELGGMIRNKKHGQIGTNIDFQSASFATTPQLETATVNGATSNISLLGDLLGQVASNAGQAVLSFGKPGGGVWSIITMLKTQTNTSVITQPFVTIANKTTASIAVGQVNRVVAQTVAGSNNQSGSGFTDSEANSKIDITPQINLDGVIRMKIKIDITDFANSNGDKTSKVIDTNVTVADGQVLVLGGFVKTKVAESKSKTPILGDIPILGWFFKNQNRYTTKQYYFFFLSPTIIKPRQNPGMQLYTKMKLHQATGEIESAVETRRTIDPIHNWFFNPDKENYSHKVIDFANARYQPTTVDIKNDPYYRTQSEKDYEPNVNIEEKESLIAQESADQKPQHEATSLSVEQFSHSHRNVDAEVAMITPHSFATVPIETTHEPLVAPSTQQSSQVVIDQKPHQREQFKAILTQEPSIAPPTTTSLTRDEQRARFKNTIAPLENQQTAPKKPSNTVDRFIFDPNKRNNLKEFLSAGNATGTTALPGERDGQRT